jgi:DhnA family fructose-bisphosphate aldolase class Ia
VARSWEESSDCCFGEAMAAKNWQRAIATAALPHISKDREHVIVEMNGRGKLFVHEGKYATRRAAVGQATRIGNEARGDVRRTYVVTRYGDKCAVFLDTHTVLYHGACK